MSNRLPEAGAGIAAATCSPTEAPFLVDLASNSTGKTDTGNQLFPT
jgi:hypothetical protein